jgi:hypothetical protein
MQTIVIFWPAERTPGHDLDTSALSRSRSSDSSTTSLRQYRNDCSTSTKAEGVAVPKFYHYPLDTRRVNSLGLTSNTSTVYIADVRYMCSLRSERPCGKLTP